MDELLFLWMEGIRGVASQDFFEREGGGGRDIWIYSLVIFIWWSSHKSQSHKHFGPLYFIRGELNPQNHKLP